MSQDIKVEQDNYGSFDIVVDESASDYDSVDGMDTAVDVQLFVDRRAQRHEISRPRDRQGWIGDVLTKQDGYEMGSLIHLKNQARNTNVDKNLIAEYAKDGLEYFRDINAAKEINASVVGDDIAGSIVVDESETIRFNKLWRNTGGS